MTQARPQTKLAYLSSIERGTETVADPDPSRPKFFVTFPYPYMNGKLHLGHLFSLSKADFMAYFRRLQNYNVLFPFAFHCTGMPISASAAKLADELEGREVDQSVASILSSLGFEDPRPFTDPVHWIRVFPSLATSTLQALHTSIDWRRSFITTDINPFYDSFVRFQFSVLRSAGYISFGKRYSIFCTISNQACLDHDRRKGEGIKPRDVVLRKIVLETHHRSKEAGCGTEVPVSDTQNAVLSSPSPVTGAHLESRNDSFATTEAFLVRVSDAREVRRVILSTSCKLRRFAVSGRRFVAEDWVYQNLIHQVERVSDFGVVDAADFCMSIVSASCLAEAETGGCCPSDVGLSDVSDNILSEPNTNMVAVASSDVHIFRQMERNSDREDISGTGSGNNCSRDATDAKTDAANCMVPDAVADGADETESVEGTAVDLACTAAFSLESLSLKSTMSPVVFQLAEGKEASPKAVYEKGAVGRVSEENKDSEAATEYAEILARRNDASLLVESQRFVRLSEPDGVVISRAGSRCVVALLDQWFIDYSSEEWKARVRECISLMTLSEDSRQKLNDALAWIDRWGCSRSFGLGTRLPWDKTYLIDSLSDSTIYMAFYTVKHLLFSDLQGNKPLLPPEIVDEDFWSLVFFGNASKGNKGSGKNDGNEIKLCESTEAASGAAKCHSTTEQEIGEDMVPPKLAPYIDIVRKCRQNFLYFYPVDLRVSGKDLIPNHLLFFLFHHVAIFSKECWPRRIFTNGHVLLNSAKMSKSDGNFLSAEEAIERYGASGTRMCLAACGDGNEDANFEEAVANSSVLRLYSFVQAVEQLDSGDESVLAKNIKRDESDKEKNEAIDQGNEHWSSRCQSGAKTASECFADKVFVQSLSRNIKESVEAYESMRYRDVLKYGFYENLHLIELYQALGGKSKAMIEGAYRTITQLMWPIVPGVSNYLAELRGWPLEVPQELSKERDGLEAAEYIKELSNRLVSTRKGRGSVVITVGRSFPQWKKECMSAIESLGDKKSVLERASGIAKTFGVQEKKLASFCMDYVRKPEKYTLSFDEYEVLDAAKEYIERNVGASLILEVADPSSTTGTAEPKKPAFRFI